MHFLCFLFLIGLPKFGSLIQFWVFLENLFLCISKFGWYNWENIEILSSVSLSMTDWGHCEWLHYMVDGSSGHLFEQPELPIQQCWGMPVVGKSRFKKQLLMFKKMSNNSENFSIVNFLFLPTLSLSLWIRFNVSLSAAVFRPPICHQLGLICARCNWTAPCIP